ncbi:TOPRIM nucleotidyl transferase/hydrolase domain-containing protein [Streptomyces sp. NPDC093085]|uniref:TOPRIM nucleotidyl transferase/hydrolase domain-containing protein n=1 Tax=Streptomyces sp. NPDC093085 TaxID=3155068 RepID=UPI00341EA986
MAGMGAFRDMVTAWAANDAGAPGDPRGLEDLVRESAVRLSVRTAVLLEGPSDAAAVEALAERRGRDLAAEGICVLPMGGAMSVGRYAGLLGSPGLGLRLTGLCDEAERPYYVRGFEQTGAARSAFFVCTADLEDELIRALGVPRVMELIEAEGDLRPVRTFLRQPAQRGRTPHQRLRRFLGTKKGRKIQYGRVLTEALAPDRTPPPLNALLATL